LVAAVVVVPVDTTEMPPLELAVVVAVAVVAVAK
jgi:hypothetical protein